MPTISGVEILPVLDTISILCRGGVPQARFNFVIVKTYGGTLNRIFFTIPSHLCQIRFRVQSYQKNVQFLLQTILNEAKDRLSEVQQNKGRYKELLSGLIAQGLFQILEDDVIIKCLPEEIELIQVSEMY